MKETEIRQLLIGFIDGLDMEQRGCVLTDIAFLVQEPWDATGGDFWKLLMMVRARYREDVYSVPR